jgi:hypothetical protein
MSKIGEHYIFDTSSKLYADGSGRWFKINEMNKGYSKGYIEYHTKHGFSNIDWVFVKIEEDGQIKTQ